MGHFTVCQQVYIYQYPHSPDRETEAQEEFTSHPPSEGWGQSSNSALSGPRLHSLLLCHGWLP